MNKRTILSVAFPFARISESTAGGAEQILNHLDLAITSSGNNSLVFAQKGSSVNGQLIEFDFTCDLIDDAFRKKFYKHYRRKLSEIIWNKKIDLIHFHGLDFAEYFPEADIAALVTLHLPLDWYKAESFSIKGVHYNCVSSFQFLKYRSKIGGPVSLIENGVDIPECIPVRGTGKYTLSMGRICPEKGYHLAIKASRNVKLPFVLAGSVYPYDEHLIYFHQKIRPAIDNNECVFIGEVGNVRKKRLFRHAVCLLVPSLVEETSSLVAMEAMAFGVPVVAFKAGALNDLIRQGENGFLVNDEMEMSEAILEIAKIDPIKCHNMAKDYYAVSRMTSQYLQLYENIIDGNSF